MQEKRKRQQHKETVVDKGPTVGQEIVENSVDTKFMSKAMNSNNRNNKRKDKSSDTVDDYVFENFKKKSRERWRR